MDRLDPAAAEAAGSEPDVPAVGDPIELSVGQGGPGTLRVQFYRVAVVILALAQRLLGSRPLDRGPAALGDVAGDGGVRPLPGPRPRLMDVEQGLESALADQGHCDQSPDSGRLPGGGAVCGTER